MPDLDLAGLPLQGRHLIEASAGTGKTYSITRIYLRLLLEKQIPVEQILLMTYTRAATQELRGRIEDTLRDAQKTWGSHKDDYWQHLYQRVDSKQATLLLHQALLHLDQAAIFTIHGFCGRALQQYAFTSQTGLEVILETNTSDIAFTGLQDWLRVVMHQPEIYKQLEQHGWHTPQGFWDAFNGALLSQTPVFASNAKTWHQAWYTNKAQVRASLLELEAQMVEATMGDSKTKRLRLEQWQDLINWLGAHEFGYASKQHLSCLDGRRLSKFPELKPKVKALLQRINNEAFKKGYLLYAQQASVAPLVLEAVEIVRKSYKKAKQKQQVMEFDDLVRRLAECIALPGNEALIKALQKSYPVALVDEFQDTDAHQYAILNQLYTAGSDDTALFMIGDPKQAIYGFRGGDIHTYLKAAEATDYRWHMQTNWRSSQAMVLAYNRLFLGGATGRQLFGAGIHYSAVNASKYAVANQVDNARAKGVALNYVWLPTQLATNERKHQHIARWCAHEIQSLLAEGHFQANDIAMLVRGAAEAQALQAALKEAGLTSVYISDRSSVYASLEATEMVRLLQGVLHCEDQRQLVRAASTHLWGGDISLLAQLTQDDECLVKVRSQMMQLRQMWLTQGVMALVVHLLKHQAMAPSINAERYMTNMVQLAELLQKASTQASSALLLVEWLQQQCEQDHTDSSAELRLESDAKLIQIVTQHGSKGLEYPVVFIPFASQAKDPLKRGGQHSQLFSYYHPQQQCPALMIGRDTLVCDEATKAAQEEATRLLYVAVTRAQYRCYIAVSDFTDGQLSPLGQIAFEEDDNQHKGFSWPDALAKLTHPNDSHLMQVEEDLVQMPTPQNPLATDRVQLKAQQFSGVIDSNHNLLSYSALVRQLNHAAHTTQSSVKDRDDGTSQLVEANLSASSNELRFTLAKGKNSGLLLHDILEQVDFNQPVWSAAMEVPLAKYHTMVGIDEDDAKQVELLQQWLEQCLAADFPPVNTGVHTTTHTQSGFSLNQLEQGQTLREAEFYFPLQQAKQSTLAQILSRHRGGLPTALPSHPILQGMMHGFIDLVFEHDGQYYVADYKSNHLGDCVDDYHHQAMLETNQNHYYDLQYLIYSLALHRYLLQRLPHYDPALHFGGVYYLYLRGMAPQSTNGVFATAISLQELNELDGLFAGETL
ncbi:MAG: exodeoxyribonuclease V subunit beta [Gammaproteobacteria bacterium]|nr:exodeoxyribonuclease V subunit beta [Gammaproteobacteria bacterium]